MPVEMVTRKLRSDGDERGMLVYGYKFRPVMSSLGITPNRNRLNRSPRYVRGRFFISLNVAVINDNARF